MSTWSSDAFGNDYAMDWAQDLQETKSLELIESTIDNVIDNGAAYLDAPFAAEALAAIEVMARLQGHAGDDELEDVDAWVARCKRKVTPFLAGKAHQAIDRILADDSELRELWQASDDYAAWRDGVEALKARITL